MPKAPPGFLVADDVRLHAASQRHVLQVQDLQDVEHHGDRALHVGRTATKELLPVFGNGRVEWTSSPGKKIRNGDGVEVPVHDDSRPSGRIAE